MSTYDHARGKWREILTHLIGPECLDGKNHPCPKGEGTDRFRFDNNRGKGDYFCACGPSDGFDLLQCYYGCDHRTAVQMVESVIGKPEQRSARPGPTWGEKLRDQTLKGQSRSKYLEGRELRVAPALEWHPSLPYYRDNQHVATYPAMLAPFWNEGRFITYHVTYIENADKAPVDPPRKILPANYGMNGGACPLYPAKRIMGIAEGVETAIAAHLRFDVPVWAALNTSLMAAWKPPEAARKILIFADHDRNYAGHAAAYKLAHRLYQQGYGVAVMMPQQPDTDWADVWKQAE